MKVAVIGATGNAGTAILKALSNAPEITDVLGIARRMPDTAVEPYSGCRWESIDIAAASPRQVAIDQLTSALRGVDAVIHLAWMIQPNDQRDLLRRVNVEGTRRVAEAVAAAQVPHLVVASSVGAYSPDPERKTDSSPLRAEAWETGGISSSHYSVDKSDQERVLDEFMAAHPEVKITRLRPALTFQADAASEIQRYFLGSYMPVQMLRSGPLPVLPLPKGLKLQAIHADDLARAYVAAVVTGAEGAFNICADDILGPRELAEIVDGGKFVELPPSMVRAALVAAHASGVVPADAGWLDMGLGVPMLDNSRAKEELQWSPRLSAAQALTELIDAMAAGRGAASPPLRPRDDNQLQVPAAHEHAGRGAETGDAQSPGASEIEHRKLLELYLSDHLTGATAGRDRIERMANDFVDTPVFAQIASVSVEIRAERALLKNIIHDLGLAQKPYRQAAAATVERVGRLKGNGRVVRRSPMTLLLETELMRSAVIGKAGVWETLRDNSEMLGLDPEVFSALVEAIDHQVELLSEVHAYARNTAFQ